MDKCKDFVSFIFFIFYLFSFIRVFLQLNQQVKSPEMSTISFLVSQELKMLITSSIWMMVSSQMLLQTPWFLTQVLFLQLHPKNFTLLPSKRAWPGSILQWVEELWELKMPPLLLWSVLLRVTQIMLLLHLFCKEWVKTFSHAVDQELDKLQKLQITWFSESIWLLLVKVWQWDKN